MVADAPPRVTGIRRGAQGAVGACRKIVPQELAHTALSGIVTLQVDWQRPDQGTPSCSGDKDVPGRHQEPSGTEPDSVPG